MGVEWVAPEIFVHARARPRRPFVAAFIGTRDLGQEMQRALSSTDVGKGLVLGLCVAFMGLLVDHLITVWGAARRRSLGLG